MSLRKIGIFNFGGWSNAKNERKLSNKNFNFMENYRVKIFLFKFI